MFFLCFSCLKTGSGGHLTTSTPNYASPLVHAFVEAAKLFGYPDLDYNGPRQTGFAIAQGTIRRGGRCSTAKAFLRDFRGQRPNLHVVIYAHVTRVIFNSQRRAVAVKFERKGLHYVVHARREIILSAGAINSPQLLMLSGVGPSEHLKSLGIPVVYDSPGVGLNLQDHVSTCANNFLMEAPISITLPRVLASHSLEQWFALGNGYMSTLGGVEGLGFISTKYSNQSDDWPDIQYHFLPSAPGGYGGWSSRGMRFKASYYQQVYNDHLYDEAYTYCINLLRPEATGFIRLRSASPYDVPIIDPNYFPPEHPVDILRTVEGMKLAIKMGLSKPFQKFGVRLWDKLWPKCDKFKPYSAKYLECLARSYTGRKFTFAE